MKISLLKESLCVGGTERSVANISIALAEKNDVELVLYDGSELSYSFGGKLVDLSLPAQATTIKRVFNNFKRIVRYTSYLKKTKPDIVYQFISQNNPVGLIPIKKSKKIVSCRDFGALKGDLKKFKVRLDCSDAMICNSQYMCDYYIERYPEDKNKVFAVNNIIDIDNIKISAKDSVDHEFMEFCNRFKYKLVSVGRFCEEKAFENLILSFKKVNEVNQNVGLVLVGDGKLKEEYLTLINKYDISDFIYFTGYQKNPYKYMAMCDVFVLSSKSEGFPNVLVEAMALSLPVVSVNCLSGPAEILLKNADYSAASDNIVEADFGILTPHYDNNGTDFAVAKLSEAILSLLSNADLMQQYGKLAFNRASDFSKEAAVKKFDIIFEYLISKY